MGKNYFIFTLLFSFVIDSCTQKHLIVKKEKAGLIFKAEMENWHKEGSFNYLLIKITLINNSPDTIRYVNMYCDSDKIYVLDNKKLNIHWGVGCDKNFPLLHILFPYQKEQSGLEARTQEDTFRLSGEKFRVGFNYIAAKNNEDARSKFDSLLNQKHLIWSDTLTIK